MHLMLLLSMFMSELPSLLPLNRQRIIKYKVKIRVPVHLMSVFDKRMGCFFTGKSQRFLKIRLIFWPEISALGLFLKSDNERMYPPKYLSAPRDLIPSFLEPRVHVRVWMPRFINRGGLFVEGNVSSFPATIVKY